MRPPSSARPHEHAHKPAAVLYCIAESHSVPKTRVKTESHRIEGRPRRARRGRVCHKPSAENASRQNCASELHLQRKSLASIEAGFLYDHRVQVAKQRCKHHCDGERPPSAVRASARASVQVRRCQSAVGSPGREHYQWHRRQGEPSSSP